MTKQYRDWFIEKWYKHKGLIAPIIAGKIVDLSGARIIQIWEERKLPIYRQSEDKKEKPLIGWNDFLDFKEEREAEKEDNNQ